MVKLLFFIGVVVVLSIFTTEAALRGDCPLSSQTTTCTPKCIADTDCSSNGGICCPNLCNTKSCVRPKVGSAGTSSGSYKGSSSTATGVYCGNVKCHPSEKCIMDRQTKREKCGKS